MAYDYLASAYTHKDPAIREARFYAVMDCLAWLLNHEHWTYSPIVHCHEMAIKHVLPYTYEFWLNYNHAMIEGADRLLVLVSDGLEESKGVAEEIAFAHSLRKPISFVHRLPSSGYRFGPRE